ncbi:MAG: type II secretion system minor pseudopilin GspJ [Halioglobus sp.]|nr:type II secretion system minor pseudopilin GspJ [Halioglobus sp.]
MSKRRSAGFTLLEVLIAMAITAFVALIATTSLSRVMDGVQSLRATADRTYEVNRAWMIISRDLRHFSERPVRDEFGQIEPALTGGLLARFPLSFTRAGWHNPNAHPRSNLQRVNYRIEDEALWRDSYPVLDRAADTEPYSVMLLDGVEDMQLIFLASLTELQIQPGGAEPDTSNWSANWVVDVGSLDTELRSPIGVEISLRLQGWGEMRRLYALPPL